MMKTPAHDEAERMVIGAILNDPTAIDEVAGTITPAHFLDQRCRLIFQAALELSKTETPINLNTIYNRLKESGKSAACGPEHVARLSNEGLMGPATFRYWQGLLRETATRRWLMEFGQRLYAEAQEPPKDFQAWLCDVGRRFNVAQTQAQTQGYRFAAEVITETFEEIEAIMDGKISKGIPTGLRELDQWTGGFKPGELILLAGRPGQGKSALALTFAHAAASGGHTVALASLEMGRVEIMRRLLSKVAETSTEVRDRAGAEWKRILDAVALIHSLPLALDDSPIQNMQTFRARARRLKREKGLALLILDYLQLMETERIKGYNREREVADLSRNLKALARELEVPVIALSQLNRDPTNREAGRPHLSDLRESGALEQDADLVLSIYRPWFADQEKYFERYARCEILKQRNGVSGVCIPLQFDGEISRFIPWTGKEDGKRG